MAVSVSVEQVKTFLGADYASTPDSTIDTYICIVDRLDECLGANYPDECVQEAIKLNAVSHFVAVTTGRNIKSQRAPSGASRSFEYYAGKEGIRLTQYGRMVQMLDTQGCFEKLYPQGSVGVLALGKKGCNSGRCY
jgi:hypothetical protein